MGHPEALAAENGNLVSAARIGDVECPAPETRRPIQAEGTRQQIRPQQLFPVVMRLPKAGHMNATWLPVKRKVSPVKSIAPLPVATTSGPTCCSVTI